MKSPNMPVVDYGGGNILYNMLIWGGTEYDIRDFKIIGRFRISSKIGVFLLGMIILISNERAN